MLRMVLTVSGTQKKTKTMQMQQQPPQIQKLRRKET